MNHGDPTSIEVNDEVLARWNKELENDPYIHVSSHEASAGSRRTSTCRSGQCETCNPRSIT